MSATEKEAVETAGRAAGDQTMSWSNPLAIARDIAAIAAVFFFFAGYVYRFTYTDLLALRRADSEPAYDFFVSSWDVFAHNPYVFVIPVSAVILLFAVRRALANVNDAFAKVYSSVEALAILAIVIATFAEIYNVANKTAVDNSQYARSSDRGAALFDFTDEFVRRNPTLASDNVQQNLRLENDDGTSYYILDQPLPTTTPLPAATMYVVPHSAVRSYLVILP